MTDARKLEVALRRDDSDRTFDAPWQAQAFAMVVELNKVGHLEWSEWVSALSEEVASSPAQRGENSNDAYYRQWLRALEQILVTRCLLAPADIGGRIMEWRSAYINTPHGQAVELSHAAHPPACIREQASTRAPIAVCLAISRVPLA
jgi:nitrile hydratase accessory protein